MNKYVIIPTCSDYNRGDQALVLESKKLGEEAGFVGEYYILNSTEPTDQIQSEGIKVASPILEHPSRKFKINNIKYSKTLKIKWGIVALYDFVISIYILLSERYRFLPKFISKNKATTLKIFKESSGVFVKGGGFLHAYGETTAWYFIYYNIYHMLLAIAHKKPVYVLPNSIGPLEGFMVRPMMKYVFKNIKVVMCRESISYNYVNQNYDAKALLFPDLGFYLEAEQNFDAITYLEKCGVPIKNKKCVAITVRPYRFPGKENGEELYSNYIKTMAKFTQYLISKKFHAVFIQHTLAENAHEDDTKSIEEIITLLETGSYSKIYDVQLNCRKLKALYSEFYCTVGTRLHSVIFSIASYIPSIAIAYGGNKSTGIMKDIGLGEFVISMDSVTTDNLIDRFDNIARNYYGIKNKIETSMKKIYKERELMVNLIKQ